MCTPWPWIGLCALALVGCRDDPAPSTTTAPPAVPDNAKDLKQRAKTKRLSPEAMKLYRLEVCYFGALGLAGTRDAYLASLGDKPPSKTNLPSFGMAESEEQEGAPADASPPKVAATATPSAVATAEATADSKAPKALKDRIDKQRDRMKERMQRRPFRMRLPYTRHIRSCTVAKKLKDPAAPELDTITAKFEKYAIGLHKVVHEAHRYYSRKQYDEDEFKRGKELHEELTKQFGELDAQLAAYSKAYQAFRGEQGAPPDELNEGGKLAEKAVAAGRALTLLMWAEGDKDIAAIDTAIGAADKALEALRGHKEEEPSSVYVRMVSPHLKRMIEAAKKAKEELDKGALSTAVLFDVTFAYVSAVDASHQALARALNPRIRRPMDPSRVKRPDVKRVRPPLRRPGKPSGAEPPTE
jgi:hypothetical protein